MCFLCICVFMFGKPQTYSCVKMKRTFRGEKRCINKKGKRCYFIFFFSSLCVTDSFGVQAWYISNKTGNTIRFRGASEAFLIQIKASNLFSAFISRSGVWETSTVDPLLFVTNDLDSLQIWFVFCFHSQCASFFKIPIFHGLKWHSMCKPAHMHTYDIYFMYT